MSTFKITYYVLAEHEITVKAETAAEALALLEDGKVGGEKYTGYSEALPEAGMLDHDPVVVELN